MGYTDLLDRTGTIVTKVPDTTNDTYNDEVLVEDHRTSVRYNLQKLSSRLDRAAPTQELLLNRETRVDLWFLFLPADAIITALDEFIDADGRTYEVLGEPAMEHKPHLGTHHVEALLRTVTG